jgi:hypothetical protein
MDVKQAPERLASCLAALAHAGAVDKAYTQRALEAAKKNCLAEGKSESEVGAIFARFMSRYKSDAT